MKNRIIATVIVVAIVLFARNGLDDNWSLMRSEFGTPKRPVVLISVNTEYEVLSAPDFGLVQFALVQARKGDRCGVPMWFVQLPYTKWRAIGR